jgi:siroheme synthase
MDPATPVVVAESVSLAEQKVFAGVLQDLPSLASKCGAGPALVLVGDVLGETVAFKWGQTPFVASAPDSQMRKMGSVPI